ncbi:protein KHNYN [Hypomesus transpacificus]|uniref:protein KHNYN n=1 Tax=Hypomesus transpacificus TaxID=137520 RepID=UPI001F07DBC4|nr:protein KHNYN [Hypomesus transpacificus]
MGYAERVVRRVVFRTGPREASEILDLVQQEQDRSDRQARERNRPSETEHREDDGGKGRGERRGGGGGGRGEEAGVLAKADEVERGRGREKAGRVPDLGDVVPLEGLQGRGEGVEGEDFVLGVLTKAAVSCGYAEEKVVEVYGSLPQLSTHQLLLQLQREEGGARETEACGAAGRGREGPREVDESGLEVPGAGDSRKGGVGALEKHSGEEATAEFASTGVEKGGARRNVNRPAHVEGGGGGDLTTAVSLTRPDQAQLNVSNRLRLSPPPPNRSPLTTLPAHPNQAHPPFHASPKRVRGPPQSTYPPTLHFPPASPPKHGPRPTYPPTQTPQPPFLLPPPTGPLPPIQIPYFSTISSPPAPTVRDRRGLPVMPAGSGAVVTGEQRFLEGLQTTFDLQLTGDPGDPGLRMIIIDGSNVAMSHGLGQFFSCRGIALAVQHFWNRGHRQITTFVPQWRSKRDSRVKEQHYLTELQTLGLLSYTPSREVQGRRINSYDDRFMLQLAHKTEGVIVTNDNLRDLLDESLEWIDIIKKRLLPYTFVGDHFMVPDDPLGRGGPHLDHFLRSQHSHPRPHTEVLQFRDRTPGVPTGPEFSSGPGQGKKGGKGRAEPCGQGRGQGPWAERSPADTARLREGLSQVFPDQDSMVTLVLQCNPTVTDINSLSHLMLEQQGEPE